MIEEKEKKLNLNGDWIFIKDMSGNLNIDDIKKSLSKKNEAESMTIPTNWELAGLHNYNGTIWFIREFNFNFSSDNLVVLNFLGVDYFAEVWLNWNYLGRHEGYFSPFSFNISSTIKSNNILVVKATSPFEIPGEVWPDHKKLIKGIFNHHDCRPGGTSKEFGQDQNTGGIWNDVFIEYGYKINIENIKATSTLLENGNKAEVKLNIKYFSSLSGENTYSAEFQVISPSGNQLIFKSELEFKTGKNELSYSININTPKLWWNWDLGTPNLYYLKLTSDFFNSYELKFGIRKIYLDDKYQFFINGKKLFLRGTNIIPTQFLSELNNSKIDKIVSLMKEANINIVRVHAHVNRKEFYEECDKQGILVWQDFSLQWTYDESDSFKNNAVTQIKEMVSLLYNHPSIAFWCCHNEPGDQINSLDPLLEEAVKSIDNSRIVRRASNYEEHAYDGWYWGDKEHYAAAPMGPLVTEFGAQALPELNSLNNFISSGELFPPKWSAWKYHDFQVDQTFNIAKVEMGDSINSFIENSQDYQADVLKTAIDFYRRKRFDGINGIFQFMFIDCWPSITWSIVDFYGKVKKGYDVLKTAYQPVYISINLRQNQYFAGSKLLFDLYLINDMYKKIENNFIRFSLNESEIAKFEVESIPENGMVFLDYKLFNYFLPENLNAGLYTFYIDLICQNSGEKISENKFEFKVVNCP
jgi:beta-mannosidase